ncbi:hypothetical protein V1478_003129, partial [Vespula squamosa]
YVFSIGNGDGGDGDGDGDLYNTSMAAGIRLLKEDLKILRENGIVPRLLREPQWLRFFFVERAKVRERGKETSENS